MMDDSLPDAVMEMHAPAFDRMSNESMIAELKRRGYKVYPEKRVRIYEVHTAIDRHKIEQLRGSETLARILEHADARNALSIGNELSNSGALIRSRREGAPYHDEIRTAQVCVVLPNDWDFESEMWGVR